MQHNYLLIVETGSVNEDLEDSICGGSAWVSRIYLIKICLFLPWMHGVVYYTLLSPNPHGLLCLPYCSHINTSLLHIIGSWEEEDVLDS